MSDREFKKSTGILIFDSIGRLAMQLRAAHDDSFPSHWDFAAGGGVDVGEEEKESAERELKEELGISADISIIGKRDYEYAAWKPGVMRKAELWLYHVSHGGPFSPNPDEIQKVDFFSKQELVALMGVDKIHPEFLCAWDDGTIPELFEKNRGPRRIASLD